ncbi:MAG: DMT family transporter [Candidatus Nanopelagicales bacterium]
MPVGTGRPPLAPARVWLPSWLLLVVVWGFAFLFIKVAVEVLAPLQVAFGRVALGAAVVLVLVAVTRRRLPRDWRAWRDVSVVALFLHTAPFTLFAFGETRISSVLAGIWNATTPLWAVLFGLALLPEERLTRERLAGLTLGFVGVLVVLGVWQGVGGADLLGSAACVAATACYGVGVSLTRRLLSGRPEGPLPVVAAQLTSGSLQLAVLVLLFTAPPGSLPLDVVGAMLLLGVASTGLAFVLNFRIVRDAGPVVSAATTYATPLVSTVAGVVLLGEPLAWYQPVGAVVVLSGVALIQGLVRLPRRARPEG